MSSGMLSSTVAVLCAIARVFSVPGFAFVLICANINVSIVVLTRDITGSRKSGVFSLNQVIAGGSVSLTRPQQVITCANVAIGCKFVLGRS